MKNERTLEKLEKMLRRISLEQERYYKRDGRGNPRMARLQGIRQQVLAEMDGWLN